MKKKLVANTILLKLSGEMLMGDKHAGIEKNYLQFLTSEIKDICKLNVKIGIVIGGGNFIRGINFDEMGLSKTTADQMGMLATVMNGLALNYALETAGVPSKVLSSISIPTICETYSPKKANEYLTSQVLIFVAGTGSPHFTTDTAAALRAIEIKASLFLKATKVDGVYSDDPVKNSKAKKYATINYDEVLSKNLKALDLTAISMCKEHKLPICVFNLAKGNIKKILLGEKLGTIIN